MIAQHELTGRLTHGLLPIGPLKCGHTVVARNTGSHVVGKGDQSVGSPAGGSSYSTSDVNVMGDQGEKMYYTFPAPNAAKKYVSRQAQLAHAKVMYSK